MPKARVHVRVRHRALRTYPLPPLPPRSTPLPHRPPSAAVRRKLHALAPLPGKRHTSHSHIGDDLEDGLVRALLRLRLCALRRRARLRHERPRALHQPRVPAAARAAKRGKAG